MANNDIELCAYGASILNKQLNAFQAEIVGVRIGNDIEYIHRMRVASRRLRSTLPLFRACFGNKVRVRWLKEIKRITRALGQARDTDVQIFLLDSILHELPDAQFAPGIRRILLRRQQTRQLLQLEVLKSLDRVEQSGVLGEIGNLTLELSNSWEPSSPFTRSMYELSAKAILSGLESVFSHQESVLIPENVSELHAMRVDIKKLRYTLEVFAPLYPEPIKKTIQICRMLQDLLGDIHDCDVWIAELPRFQEAEKQRVLDYFGNVGQLKRLIPGFTFFQQNRSQLRSYKYEEFLRDWKNLHEENHWEIVNTCITRPLSFLAESVYPQQNNPETGLITGV